MEVEFHGCGLRSAIEILANGLRPTLGTGGEHLQQHYEVAVPGVYLADSMYTASGYPMEATTKPQPEETKHGMSGATLIAEDGSYPLRVVFRVLVRKETYLWKKMNTKSGTHNICTGHRTASSHTSFL